MYDAWIITDQASWDLLVPSNSIDAYVLRNAKTGFWKTVSGLTVFNVLADSDTLERFRVQLGIPGTQILRWEQGPGFDAISDTGDFLVEPNSVLLYMRDHEEYDENGDVISTTPATFENPNWGHVFLGQDQRIFAGVHSVEFSEEFF